MELAVDASFPDDRPGLLVCHCSSGQNNVVVTEFAASGFTDLGRPDSFS